jgi:colicin import membrane protein
MKPLARSYRGGPDRSPLIASILISIMAHALLFGLVLYSPGSKSGRLFMPSVINVQMVDLAGGGAASDRPIEVAPEPAAPAPDSPRPAEARPAPAPQPQPAAPEISLAPQPPRAKTPLKYETMRPREAVRPSTPPRAERRPAPAPVSPLEETIRRLREQVEKEGRPGTAAGEGTGQGSGGGGRRGFGFGGGQELEAIDLYRLEVAYAIQKNWAYADQLAGSRGDRVASIVFKVMPDGRIEDIFFTDRSGNPHLDESGYRAIVKSSPVRPHPRELNRPYIEMGLRFTPEGVQ